MKFPNNTDAFAYRAAEIAKHSEARDFWHTVHVMRYCADWSKAEKARVFATRDLVGSRRPS